MNADQKAVFTPDVVTALRLLEQLAQGKSAKEAMDTVCGVGTHDKFASDLYDQLRAKGAAQAAV